jgi:hypothetical protein
LHFFRIFGSLDEYRYKYSKVWFISKTRYVQSLEENFAVFIVVFVPAFSATFVPIFSAVLISAVTIFPAIFASAFAFVK